MTLDPPPCRCRATTTMHGAMQPSSYQTRDGGASLRSSRYTLSSFLPQSPAPPGGGQSVSKGVLCSQETAPGTGRTPLALGGTGRSDCSGGLQQSQNETRGEDMSIRWGEEYLESLRD